MSKNLSGKYYRENKERIKIFLKKKRKKSENMVVNVTKIFHRMENKSLLSIEKNIIG